MARYGYWCENGCGKRVYYGYRGDFNQFVCSICGNAYKNKAEMLRSIKGDVND